MTSSLRLDLFCQVIDNYGDAGVCWRLARQLATERGFRVRLWIDKPAVLQKICPDVIPEAMEQSVCGVDICRWLPDSSSGMADDMPDVVVEGFGARLSEYYVRQMAAKQEQPVWINLEYLTAESWAEESHLLASPQSWIPLTKYFYFPGFTEKTGGLIRENGLIEARDHFQADRQNAVRFLSSLGVEAETEYFMASLFCYPDAPVVPLLESFRESGRKVLCLIPEGVATEAVRFFTGRDAVAGTRFSTDSLNLQILPMIEQNAYDRLLWSCDLNFVRGEDSFVRAQWAARPFVWHIYPQEESIHLVKLGAFLDRYLAGLLPENAEIVKRFWYAWNAGKKQAGLENAEEFGKILPQLKQHGRDWSKKMKAQPDLASGLVRFINTLR